MKLYDYIPEALLMQRIEEGYVNVNHHKKFPLAIYTYSKSATFDYVWDEATCKCRGLIVNLTTMEIIARPFEKFFNVGERAGITREQFPKGLPIITDKLDGNLITLYQWQGTWYAASKGSFHSEHADWANAWLAKNETELLHFPRKYHWPEGYTPVFEMIAEDLEHHVVHYGPEAAGLYLIAFVNIRTGEELNEASKTTWAAINDVPEIPQLYIDIDKALTDNEKNAEGYVLAWERPGQTPLRAKVKFAEFLRLQKLVHNVGPKEILDYMSQPHLQCYLEEVLDPKRSHEVFIKYVKAWMERISGEYMRIHGDCWTEYEIIRALLGRSASRKAYAELIGQKEYPSILFAMLDKDLAEACDSALVIEQYKRIERQIWKQVEPFVEHEDIHGVITQEE